MLIFPRFGVILAASVHYLFLCNSRHTHRWSPPRAATHNAINVQNAHHEQQPCIHRSDLYCCCCWCCWCWLALVAASRTFLSARLFNRLSFSAPSSTTATSSSFSRPSARLAGCVRLGARNTHARARLARFQTRTRFTDGKSMARPFQPRYASRTVFFFSTRYIPSTVS